MNLEVTQMPKHYTKTYRTVGKVPTCGLVLTWRKDGWSPQPVWFGLSTECV